VANWRILKKYKVKSIALFGSYVKNEQREDSDIDLLVKFKFKEDTYSNFINLIFALEDLLKKKVTVVTKEGFEPIYPTLCIKGG
jgi:hypothetical protein